MSASIDPMIAIMDRLREKAKPKVQIVNEAMMRLGDAKPRRTPRPVGKRKKGSTRAKRANR